MSPPKGTVIERMSELVNFRKITFHLERYDFAMSEASLVSDSLQSRIQMVSTTLLFDGGLKGFPVLSEHKDFRK